MATIVGGNFGGKNEITTEPVLALLSKKTGRPVKSVFTRPDEFIASTTRHPLIMDYKTGVTKDGKVQTLHGRTTLVFVKQGGQWKIVSAHFSPLPHA